MGEGLPRQDIGVIFLLYCNHFLSLSDKLKVYFKNVFCADVSFKLMFLCPKYTIAIITRPVSALEEALYHSILSDGQSFTKGGISSAVNLIFCNLAISSM